MKYTKIDSVNAAIEILLKDNRNKQRDENTYKCFFSIIKYNEKIPNGKAIQDSVSKLENVNAFTKDERSTGILTRLSKL
jgi:hypothetical protein